MKNKASTPDVPRRDRLIRERVHDPYKAREKPPEPTVCAGCGAVFHAGRWQWIAPRPVDAHEEWCQACRRIRDDYPAGIVTLGGRFASTHKEELLSLIRRQEQEENEDHPLHRVMRIEESVGAITVLTTDIHLPHRIGEAVKHAYKGAVETHYDEEGCFVRVRWVRDE